MALNNFVRQILCRFFVGVIFFAAINVQANCINPSGNAGDQRFDSGTNQMVFCDGRSWWTLRNAPISSQTLDSSNIVCDASKSGLIGYNSIRKLVEFCDGSGWRLVVESAPPPADIAPNAFSFTNLTNQNLLQMVVSEAVTISGFDGNLSANVSGHASGQVSVNGGAWLRTTLAKAGDSVRLRMNSSSAASTANNVTLTIGTTSTTWTVTTRAPGTRIFVTSTTHTAEQVGGLYGADSICQSAATAQSYGGNWRALLSDTQTSARDRVQLTYPMVNACNGSLVENTNFWETTVEGSIRAAGACTTSNWDVWTGSYTIGTPILSLTCESWRSNFGSGRKGLANSLTANFSQADVACSTASRLYCVEQSTSAAESASNPLTFTSLTNQQVVTEVLSDTVTVGGFTGTVTVEAWGKGYPRISVNGGEFLTGTQTVSPGDSIRLRLITLDRVNELHAITVRVGSTNSTWNVTTVGPGTKIFVTNSTYAMGAIGNLAGADTICQTEATAQGYSGTWIALLSTTNQSANQRLTFTYPVVNQCNNEVVESRDLWGSSLEAVIRSRSCTNSNWSVWTGSFSNGSNVRGSTCSDWSSTAGITYYGFAHHTTTGWISASTANCTSAFRLYCVSN